MKDKVILRLITLVGLGGFMLFFRRGPIKDWFLVYLFKALISAITDTSVANKKLVQYPVRYFKKTFKINIVFDYVIFPLVCVLYSQATRGMSTTKGILSVFSLSIPMTIAEEMLDRYTNLIKYSRQWSWKKTLIYLTLTFWASRFFIGAVRYIDNKRGSSERERMKLNDENKTKDMLSHINY